MALTIISANSVVGGTAFTFALSGDDLYVRSDVLLASTGSTGIDVNVTETTTQVDGSVVALGRVYNSAPEGSRLVVGQTGSMISYQSSSNDAGIVFFGTGASVDNRGQIEAPEVIAIYFGGLEAELVNSGSITGTTGVQLASGASQARVINTGSILANGNFDATLDAFEGRGIVVQAINGYVYNGVTGFIGSTATAGGGIFASASAGGLVVANFGEIVAAFGTGIDLSEVGVGQSVIRVTNSGKVTGSVASFEGSVNADILVNRGLMVGDVLLGDGADTFDTRTGMIDGSFNGGAGNDTVQSNAGQDEIFLGGTGVDTLSFRNSIAVTVALDGSVENAGAAAGDSYSSFENINGSAFADHLTGSGSANRLSGGGGTDTISGGAGADVILGNVGADVLTGGAGDDQFVFNSVAERGDKISDFGTGTGNNDVIAVKASGFGGGLVLGTASAAVFRARTDNVAQDEDDRFILRSTDKTLWFDVDGNGAGAAVMIADLQNTAEFNRLDILIF